MQFAIRPTFHIPIHCDRSQAIERFQQAMMAHANDPLYLVHGEYAEFHLEPGEHRLWSPHLTAYITGSEDADDCEVIGMFAPRPNVWTLVWIFYLAFFCCIFFAAVFGGSQWLVGELPWGLFVAGVCAVLYVCLFIVSQVGQSLCHDQMDFLRAKLDRILSEANLVSTPSNTAGAA